MTLQQILSPIRKAVDDYHMIEDDDTIAVGISGGKDSLTLLNGLYALMRFYPHSFKIPVVKSPCPADGYTRREYIKNLLRSLNRENPGVKDRMFTAVLNGLDDYLIDERSGMKPYGKEQKLS